MDTPEPVPQQRARELAHRVKAMLLQYRDLIQPRGSEPVEEDRTLSSWQAELITLLGMRIGVEPGFAEAARVYGRILFCGLFEQTDITAHISSDDCEFDDEKACACCYFRSLERRALGMLALPKVVAPPTAEDEPRGATKLLPARDKLQDTVLVKLVQARIGKRNGVLQGVGTTTTRAVAAGAGDAVVQIVGGDLNGADVSFDEATDLLTLVLPPELLALPTDYVAYLPDSGRLIWPDPDSGKFLAPELRGVNSPAVGFIHIVDARHGCLNELRAPEATLARRRFVARKLVELRYEDESAKTIADDLRTQPPDPSSSIESLKALAMVDPETANTVKSAVRSLLETGQLNEAVTEQLRREFLA